MRPSFVNLPKPFIVSVIRESPDLAIANIKNSEYDGAQAHMVHLEKLDAKFHNAKDLRRIIASTANPMLMVNYRDPSNKDQTDDERIKVQLLAIEQGASAIDIPADYFDVNRPTKQTDYRNGPALELSMDPAVIAKQKKLIETVHSMGGEVLLSSHTRVVMNCEQVVAHAKEMESRGPDMVKVVSVCTNERELVEGFKTIVELKRTLRVPFQFQCHGEHGKLLRVVGPMLGSSLVFCNQEFKAYSFTEQPLVRAMRSVFANVDWKVSKPAEEENFDQT